MAEKLNLKSYKKNTWLLTPLFGSLLYIFLYINATLLYPGGSQVDKTSNGFSWSQNYWCNLLNETAINGQPNTARPMALAAMFVLCITLAIFWYYFPLHTKLSNRARLIIQLSGFLSMLIGSLLFTNIHDTIINIASFFGLIAITGTFIGLYQLKWIKLFWFGIFNLALIILNNILYYGDDWKIYLPLVQKFSFLSFLVWICLIDINLYRRKKAINEQRIVQ